MDHQRVARLFEAALDKPAATAGDWLKAECSDDPALLAEVQRLLRADADAEAGTFLETPLDVVSLIAHAEQAAIAPERFGAYRVLRSIGCGGMGEVWLGERSDGEFHQRVAIKQLAYPTPGLLQRFRQERQILAQLDHPGIARLYDGGADATGVPYLVMEYVEGESITRYAQSHQLDLRTRLDLFLQVCAAVQYAHQNLIVHRDLKPSNILVTKDGCPKLLDFGIAKLLATTDPDTRTATRLMTPGYAAPEQVAGAPITTATDVYALGVLLHELLTGAKPTHDTGAGEADTVRPPSQVPLESAGPRSRRELRGDLDRIVLTALAADPKRRYASPAELAGDLRLHLEGRPIVARGQDRWYRVRRMMRRHRYLIASVAAVFLVLAVAMFVSLDQARRAQEEAELSARHAARADALTRFMVGIFEQANPDENGGQPFTARDLLQRGERQLADFGEHSTGRFGVTGLLASLYWNVGDRKRATALFDDASADLANPAIADEVKAKLLVDRSAMEVDNHDFASAIEHAMQALELASGAGEKGQYEASAARRAINYALVRKRDSVAAEAPLRHAIEEDTRIFGEMHDAVADSLSNLGTVLDDLGRYDESGLAFERALYILRTLHGDRHSSVLAALNDYGLMLLHKGDLPGAESALQESLDGIKVLLGPEHPNTVSAQSNLLRVLEMRGRFAEVLPQRLHMLEVEQARPDGGRLHKMALAYNFIGVDQREMGRFSDAERSFRQSLAIWRQIHGADDSADSATPQGNLGITLRLQGRFAEAETALRTSLNLELASASSASQWTNVARADLGTQLRLQNRSQEAVEELTAANEGLRALGSGAASWRTVVQAALSEALLDNGDAGLAETTAREALEIADEALPEGNVRRAIPLFALARAQLELHKAAEAEALLREALTLRGAVYPAHDPRMFELKVALLQALRAQQRDDEARTLEAETAPVLRDENSDYLAVLRKRLGAL